MSLAELHDAGFDIDATNHAVAILSEDFRACLEDLCTTLLQLRISCRELLTSNGKKFLGDRKFLDSLTARRWISRKVVMQSFVDAQENASVTYELDHVKDDENGSVALSINWNNSESSFDRDLEKIKRLHSAGAISAGVVVTRGASLQGSLTELISEYAKAYGIAGYRELTDLGLTLTAGQVGDIERQMDGNFVDAWSRTFVSDKFGATTTHWAKLQERVSRGVGNPCPLLLLGIPASAVTISDTD